MHTWAYRLFTPFYVQNPTRKKEGSPFHHPLVHETILAGIVLKIDLRAVSQHHTALCQSVALGNQLVGVEGFAENVVVRLLQHNLLPPLLFQGLLNHRHMADKVGAQGILRHWISVRVSK